MLERTKIKWSKVGKTSWLRLTEKGALGPGTESFVVSSVSDSATPWTVAHQLLCPPLSPRIWEIFMSIKSVMLSNHLILSRPGLILPSTFPSIRGFSHKSAIHIRWSKYWSFSFSIIPSNEYSGLISFRINWFDLLAVQGTLKSSSTPQFKGINSSVLSLLYGPTHTPIHDYWK